MSQKPSPERRNHPRLINNVPVRISREGEEAVTETINISRSGAYCRCSKYVEPMTKMKVSLLLPIRKHGKSNTRKISCEGVVVRTEEAEEENCFYVAIFFSDITQRDAEAIADYIQSYLEQ